MPLTLCLIAVDVVGKHDFGRDILPHRESEVAKQSAVHGGLRMPVVQNGEDLWATLFVSDAVLSVHLPGGRIDDQTGLVLDLQSFMAAFNNATIPDTISLTLPPKPALHPSAAALEHKRHDRLTPLGRLVGLAIAALSLAGFSQRSFPANRHGAAPRTAKMASDQTAVAGACNRLNLLPRIETDHLKNRRVFLTERERKVSDFGRLLHARLRAATRTE
jgi:hypothetical protein